MAGLQRVLDAARRQGRVFEGEREIPLDRIAGTAAAPGKAAEFDPAFLPVDRRLRDRWQRICTAMTEGDELPPTDVYRLGGSYLVVDGHRRVSVAPEPRPRDHPPRGSSRSARARRFRRRSAPEEICARDLLRMAEYAAFLELRELDRLRPEAPRGEPPRALRRADDAHPRPPLLPRPRARRGGAAAGGRGERYDNVFAPVRDLIQRHGILDTLPCWTEVDAYVEITKRWLELSRAKREAGPHAAAHALLDEAGERWWSRSRLAHHVRCQAAVGRRVSGLRQVEGNRR